ncbi:MAG: acetyl-CoA carboxylase carboxyl transferase subunit alpha [Pseudobutyrivibrio sp.]|nr:acetyl-CoA carboxylase carboxyl transferase subunit alpha [Pseudobutyrivibrio sp.]
MNAIDKVLTARDKNRPKITDYIDNLFTDFFEQKGDYLGKEDASIYGGIALFHGMPVTVLGHRKGNTVEENINCNFGMPGPEGYRKALRLMQQAEKFKRPIITFVDTPGAYPGLEAETMGQSQAISGNLAAMSGLKVPVISLVTGEGSSGGALGIAVANRVYMLENAIYSVLSPEGFASILWHDSAKRDEAAEVMKLTAKDLYDFGIIDGIIGEEDLYRAVDETLVKALKELKKMSGQELADDRFNKFRYIDKKYITGQEIAGEINEQMESV